MAKILLKMTNQTSMLNGNWQKYSKIGKKLPQKWQIKCQRYIEIGKNAKKLKKNAPKMANQTPTLYKNWQKY